ncbi:MAG: aminotransferase class I/II-fold pyridoxal phosphate-dependent enzyme [Chitinivibrionales bacterium]|nr:aminotransferase class I/II-fold pyridoxal phosphate-dependent enzyme [Chitinivibrionales bacterium]
MKPINKSRKLENVLYDIRGPVVEEARRLEEEGYQVLKLNTGNPAPFGLFAPDEILHDMILNLKETQGYCDSKGLFSARKAIFQYAQQRRIPGIDIEDIYTGNGASEVIVMAMQALLDDGDEMLIPSPDYPLWTAAVNLSGGKPVHYLCDEQAEWYPDIADIERKITDRTRGIVVINPNNPTGAVYPRGILESIVELARKHELIVFADEIYDKILYDDVEHVPMASLADDVLFVTINGLSKAYRVAGFRAGWMVLSGDKSHARDYMQGLEMLASMRLCSNVPGQSIIQTALGGYQSIQDLTAPGGRLREQRDLCYRLLCDMDGISCVKPKAAFYLFPRIDCAKNGIVNDEQFVLDLLRQEHILLVHGTGFNWPEHDHFRMVFLPTRDELQSAMDKLTHFLSHYQQGA